MLQKVVLKVLRLEFKGTYHPLNEHFKGLTNDLILLERIYVFVHLDQVQTLWKLSPAHQTVRVKLKYLHVLRLERFYHLVVVFL